MTRASPTKIMAIGDELQGVPKKGYPLKSSASAACSNLNVLSPQ